METKPYAIQSPEDIAKEYGGNKQRIAQAAQIGLLDPTAAVLAGMFIDRMRGAQSQEQAPQQTVAQQVLAPQPAAPAGAGLGATPEAAQLAAAYPAEGAPPPVPGPSMPQQQEPVMAADGGLMALPVDDSMFEPSYNSGGIVAFAAGSDAPVMGEGVANERERERLRQVIQARAAAITDPTARAQFLNQMTSLAPHEQKEALGEVTVGRVVSGTENAPGVIRGEPLQMTMEPRSSDDAIAQRQMRRLVDLAMERAEGIQDPTARAEFINRVNNAQPDDLRVLLGEVPLSAAPTERERLGAPFAAASENRGLLAPAVGTAQAASTATPPDEAAAPPVSDVYPDETVRGSRKGLVAVPSGGAQNRGMADNAAVTDAAVAEAAVNADPAAAKAAAKQGGIPGLQGYVDQYRQLIGAIPEGEGLKEYKEYLKTLPGELDKRKKEDLWGALTQFGFNLAGSQSPYFLQAAGQAGAQTMPAITGAIKERRGAEAEARKARAELDKMTRAEEIKAVEGGIKLYGDEQTREAQLKAARMAADKPTDMRSYVGDYVASARAAGDNQTPDSVLRQRGAETYLKLYSASEARANAALSQAGTAADAATVRARDSARDNVDKSLANNWNSPENRRIRELQKEDRKNGTNKAGEFIQDLYKAEERRIGVPSPAAAPAPAPAPAPAAAPRPAPAAAEVKSPTGKVIPAAAVAQLKGGDTPVARKQFDEVFGKGAAALVLGK